MKSNILFCFFIVVFFLSIAAIFQGMHVTSLEGKVGKLNSKLETLSDKFDELPLCV